MAAVLMATDAQEEDLADRVDRARRRSSDRRTLNPYEQIRTLMLPEDAPYNMQHESAHAYYARPDGATVRDALVLYPNGGVPSLENVADEGVRARRRQQLGANSHYYRERQGRKGFIFLGESLSPQAIKVLVRIIELNRPYEIEDVKEEIAACQRTIEESELSTSREQARRRKQQLQKRLDTLTQELDAEGLAAELAKAAKVIRMSQLSPSVRMALMELEREKHEAIGIRVDNLEEQIGQLRRTNRARRNENESINLGGD